MAGIHDGTYSESDKFHPKQDKKSEKADKVAEDNKLIAEFMRLSKLRYHKSWDWLMLVVEKIESIQDNHHGYFSVHIRNNCCSIQGTKLYKALENLSDYGPVYFSESTLDTKLSSTYNEIVNFILWYNENLK